MSRLILITGASTGVGLAIAKRLLANGTDRLVLTARPESLLRFEEAGLFPSERVFLRALDVTNAEQRRAVIDECETALGGLDVLINNAGISMRSVAEHVNDDDRLAQMDINFRSPMELTRLALPGMRSRRRGRIINVSSVGGMMAMPTMSVYSASKFALEGACEALWYEVRPWGIFVTLVEPGFINSDGFEKIRWTEMGAQSREDPNSPYHAHYRNMTTFIARIMRRVPATPDSVAKTVERQINRRSPPLRKPATFDAWAFAMLRRILPRRLYHLVLYRSLPKIKEWGPRD
ncbi:MAG: NAD(P)-dependent dehydrogenase (short-subunit alcohol dehydrogenase family) [Myxococcota bacterium]|jgi:NAD(P)-dependent dehydrogenase (short-subunit alcohol dehydrogenase family)